MFSFPIHINKITVIMLETLRNRYVMKTLGSFGYGTNPSANSNVHEETFTGAFTGCIKDGNELKMKH